MKSLVLMSPPAARTADSIALLWDKTPGVKIGSYEVYIDDKLVATTQHTDCTLQKLAADKEYAVRVQVRITGGDPVQSNCVARLNKAIAACV